ncbi:MAG: phosphoribosylamine--glycine ligase [Eubacteriales bacterium]|nr:phosphoribosylamine--glycine ligase [Eubacteriales bacterium]
MRILIIGSGGREHAIAWKLAQSSRVKQLYCAPGNAGTALLAESVPIQATDIESVKRFAVQEKIDLVFVAPDDPLAMGMVDELNSIGILAFGPVRQAARIESSKHYAKDLMSRYNIPTADYRVFNRVEDALAYCQEATLPVVIKADGLALGKGVVIAEDRETARDTILEFMCGDRFGVAGHTVVIESFLTGPELTVLAFTDGKTVSPMLTARDHKQVFDGNKGPNTGGMGAVSPGADISDDLWHEMNRTIFQPTVDAMRQEGNPFKGVLYFGLMLTPDGPKVIEYNARFGDPEAQVVLPLLKTDLVTIIEAILQERLSELTIEWQQAASCCVVLASGGYPGTYQTGYPIEGLENLPQDCYAFHAGTRLDNGVCVTGGGRVLGVTATAPTRKEAIDRAYEAVEQIHFEGMHFRKDIGRAK